MPTLPNFFPLLLTFDRLLIVYWLWEVYCAISLPQLWFSAKRLYLSHDRVFLWHQVLFFFYKSSFQRNYYNLRYLAVSKLCALSFLIIWNEENVIICWVTQKCLTNIQSLFHVLSDEGNYLFFIEKPILMSARISKICFKCVLHI